MKQTVTIPSPTPGETERASQPNRSLELDASPKKVVLDWIAAYNARNALVLADLYHEDAESFQVSMGRPVKGRAALLEGFIAFFEAFPDSYTHAERIYQDGDWVVVEWRGGGTFVGDLGPHRPTRRAYEVRGCGFFHVQSGKIQHQRGYFDKHTWLSQIGLEME